MKTLSSSLLAKPLAGILFFSVACTTSCTVEDNNEDDPNNNIVEVDMAPFVELGTLGGSGSAGFGVGQYQDEFVVVGEAQNADNEWVAFQKVIAPNEADIESLGTLGGSASQLVDVSYTGHVVGTSKSSSGSDRAVYAHLNTNLQELQTATSNAISNAVAVAEVPAGGILILGNVSEVGSNFGYRPQVWDENGNVLSTYDISGTYQDLEAVDINGSGTVVVTAGNGDEGYVIENATFTRLSTPTYNKIIPSGINDRGQISVTVYDASGENFPAIYENGNVTLLQIPPGFTNGGTNDINGDGTVVGLASSSTQITPVVWKTDGSVVNLNDLLNISQEEQNELGYSPYVNTAEAISDGGIITGNGFFNANDPEDAELGQRRREAYALFPDQY